MKGDDERELSADDTAELDRYREWLDRIYTPAETRPSWFSAETWTLRTVQAPLDGRDRYDYAGRHRSASRSPWWARLAAWWRRSAQPVPWKENTPD